MTDVHPLVCRTGAAVIASDKVSTFRTKSINLLHGLNGLFDELTQRSKCGADIAFVLECSDSLRKHSDTLGKTFPARCRVAFAGLKRRAIRISDAIVDGTTPLHDEVIEGIRSLSRRAVDEYVRTVADCGEHLGPDELTAVHDEMSAAESTAQRERIKNILDVQLLMSDVKHAIRAIGTVLGPALGIVHGHLKRLMRARNAVLVALETTFKRNDSKSNVMTTTTV